MNFSVILFDSLGHAVETSGLTLSPTMWEATAVGGPSGAEVDVSGELGAIWDLFTHIGGRIHILNDMGTVVWWGRVARVVLSTGASQVSLSLEEVRNRINIDYTYKDSDGAPQSDETGWMQDDWSVYRYGWFEERVSLPETTEVAALQTQFSWLTQVSVPEPTVEWADDVGSILGQLECWGEWKSLEYVYYSNPLGREIYDESSDLEYLLNWEVVTATAGFGKKVGGKRIHDYGGKLSKAVRGMMIDVTGSMYNNRSFTIDSVPTIDPPTATYSSTAIFYSSADELYDPTSGFGSFEPPEMILITGSDGEGYADNDGWYFIQTKQDNGNIEVWPSTILDSAPGAGSTVSRGHSMTVEEEVVDETPNGVVTMKSRGSRIAQKFRISETVGWGANEVLVRARREGVPAGNLHLQLHSDSAGVPGAVLSSVMVSSSFVGTKIDWVTFTLPATIDLVPGTDYWLSIGSSATASHLTYYSVGINSNKETQYDLGAVKILLGASWVDSWLPEVSVPFQIWGTLDIALQIQAIIYDGLSWVDRVVVRNLTGIQTRYYRDGKSKSASEIESLLKVGTAEGVRLLADVTLAGEAIVSIDPPDDGPTYDVLTGVLKHSSGAAWEPGVLPAGRIVILDNVETSIQTLSSLGTFLVDRARVLMLDGVPKISLFPVGRVPPW